MDFALTDHQKLIATPSGSSWTRKFGPLVKELEREERFPTRNPEKIGELGCCRHAHSGRWGGPGLDTGFLCVDAEEVARVTQRCPRHSRHEFAVQAPLLQFCAEAQKQKYLNASQAGEILGSFCLTKPPLAQAAGIQATATKQECLALAGFRPLRTSTA